MPKNNFKLFDENKSNMMADVDYNVNQQRLNGVQSGVASSQLQNKTLYQTALMCYALAQLMTANGYDANDADAVSTFVNNLSLSMVQKVVDKASAKDITDKTAGKWVDAKQLGELGKNIEDNYLPLLGGIMLGDLILNRDPTISLQAATKQYVDGAFSRILTGSYVGNGTKSVHIECGFNPAILFIVRGYTISDIGRPGNLPKFAKYFLYNSQEGEFQSGYGGSSFYSPSTLFHIKGFDEVPVVSYRNGSQTINFEHLSTGISISSDIDNADGLMNTSGETYYWVAIGSSEVTPGDQFIFTDDQTFSIPISGKYKIELHGIGGDGYNDGRKNSQYGGSGGGSGQLYSNINFTKGQQIPIIVGKISSGDGSSSFGSYTISRGGDGGEQIAGVASGNLASPGEAGSTSHGGNLIGGSGGSTIGNYGKGADVKGDGTITDRGEGIIILTYSGK